jgi:NADH dehydrogenase (ubiquinone) 1 alpha subcomplex subunit 10
MYDWSEGGDTEVVVEDIERLNMDYWDKYDKQQKDWRMHTEVPYILQYCLSSIQCCRS